MRVRSLLAALVAAAVVVALVAASTTATAGRACRGATGDGYTYAGHQAAYRGHGVRATLTLVQATTVARMDVERARDDERW